MSCRPDLHDSKLLGDPSRPPRQPQKGIVNPKSEIEPRIRLRHLLRLGYEGQEGGQDDGQVARMGTDYERVMETIFLNCLEYF